MSLKAKIAICAAAAGAVVAAVIGLSAAGPSGPAAGGALKAGDMDPSNGKVILYWQDPMTPAQKFDRPGRSPYMDMQLVPVYADGSANGATVSVSPRVAQNLGVRVAEAVQGSLAPKIEAPGVVAYNERDLHVVQARAPGYIERLYVRATLDRVAKGQPLADLYVPDWVAAQEEFLAVRRMQAPGTADLVDAARQRMRQAGMDEEQIQAVENGNSVQPRITLTAPADGVLIELTGREGMTVAPGTALFRINGLSTVWVLVEVPETQGVYVRPGAPIQARSAALPGIWLRGTVQTFLPQVSASTRTQTARIELANPGGRLVPGMFVTVTLGSPAGRPAVLVPSEAVIATGTRHVLMLADGGGSFRPVDIEVGSESGGQTEVLKGIQAGQKVAISGQFLLDSEANFTAAAVRMGDPAAAPATSASGARP